MAKYIELIDKYSVEQGSGDYNPPSYHWVDNTGEIVRCGECRWYAPLDRKRPFFCPVMDCATGVMEDDFCSRGERRRICD